MPNLLAIRDECRPDLWVEEEIVSLISQGRLEIGDDPRTRMAASAPGSVVSVELEAELILSVLVVALGTILGEHSPRENQGVRAAGSDRRKRGFLSNCEGVGRLHSSDEEEKEDGKECQ